MAAGNVIGWLIALNEAALSVEQIAGLVARIRNGDVPTSAEIDEILQQNDDFAKKELARVERDIQNIKARMQQG